MLNYSVDQLIWTFFVYAFLGWCVEVIFSTIQSSKFINRGFLGGPYCPIYGFGAMSVLFFLTPLKNNLLVFFLCSVLLATVIEFITGFILERNFNKKWWDYTSEKFNIKGYVCLKASIVWGAASMLVVYILQPVVISGINLIPDNIKIVLAIFFTVAFMVDVVITFISLSKVKQKVRIMQETGDRIRSLSDLIGKNLSSNTISVMKMSDRRLQELEDLKVKYQSILNKRVLGYERIARAFPKLGLTKPDKTTKKSK